VSEFEPTPLGAVVTVAGTGSECNGGAVITNEALKVKNGRNYVKCNAKFAPLDPMPLNRVREVDTAFVLRVSPPLLSVF